jgi:hypothetical protein
VAAYIDNEDANVESEAPDIGTSGVSPLKDRERPTKSLIVPLDPKVTDFGAPTRQAASRSLAATESLDHSRERRAQEVAERTGLPPSAVYADPEAADAEYTKRAELDRMGPGALRWYGDPGHAGQFGDTDSIAGVNNLEQSVPREWLSEENPDWTIGDWWEALPESFDAGKAMIELSRVGNAMGGGGGLVSVPTGPITDEERAAISAISAEGPASEFGGAAWGSLEAVKMLPLLIHTTLEAGPWAAGGYMAGYGGTIVVGGALAPFTGGGSVVATPLAAHVAGSTVARFAGGASAFRTMMELERGMAMTEFMQMEFAGLDGEMVPMDRALAWQMANVYGTLAGGAELAPWGIFAVGLSSAYRKGRKHFAKEFREKALTDPKFREILFSLGGAWVGGSLAEGATEFGQAAMQETIAQTGLNIARSRAGVPSAPMDWDLVITNAAAEGAVGWGAAFYGMGFLTFSAGGVGGAVAQHRHITMGRRSQEQFEKFTTEAGANAVIESQPEGAGRVLLQNILEENDGTFKDVHIDVPGILEALEKAGISLETLRQEAPSLAEAIDAAAEGEMAQLSIPDYIGLIRKSSKLDMVARPHLTLSPDLPTGAQTERKSAEMGRVVEDAADQVLRSSQNRQALVEQRDAIRDVLEARLLEAQPGNAALARANASLFSQMLMVMAVKDGRMPIDLFAEREIAIVGPGTLHRDAQGVTYGSDGEVIQDSIFNLFFAGSAVRDSGGKLQLLTHATSDRSIGTPEANKSLTPEGEIEFFMPWSHFGSPQAGMDRLRDLRRSREEAEQPTEEPFEGEGERFIPVYLNIKNPLEMADVGAWHNPDAVLVELIRMVERRYPGFEKSGSVDPLAAVMALAPRRGQVTQEQIQAVLEAAGYDGIVYENVHEDAGTNSFIAFRPEQVKSAFNPAPTASIDTLGQPAAPTGEAHPARVSTKVPTQGFEHGDPSLSVGMDGVDYESPWVQKIVSRILSGHERPKGSVAPYSVYRPTKSANTPEKVIERFIQAVQSNLEWLYEQTPEEVRNRAALWYDGAHNLTRRLSERYGVEHHAFVAVAATQSPQKDWYQNVALAERIVDIWKNQQDHIWDDQMEATAQRIYEKEKFSEQWDQVRGKSLGELAHSDVLQAMWIRAFSETHHDPSYREVFPEGAFGDVARTMSGAGQSIAWAGLDTIAKSVSVLRDPSVENISLRLGGAHKVRSFYSNILEPNSDRGDVTIDTHAIAAAYLRAIGSKSEHVKDAMGSGPENKPNGLQGLYPLLAEAYRRAAAEKGILPRQLQSITWEAARSMFPSTMRSVGPKYDRIEAIWDRYRAGKISIEKARQEVDNVVLPEEGGRATPDWDGSAPSAYEGYGDSSYPEELSEPGGLRGAAGRGGRGQPAGRDSGVRGLDHPGPRTTLEQPALVRGVWVDFAGAGTVEAVLGGTVSVGATEYDPAIIAQYNLAHGTNYTAADVNQVDPEEIAAADPFLYEASPVCKNFSKAKRLATANELDRKSAETVARVIRVARPPTVVIENVPQYAPTALFKLITDALDAEGYTWDVVIHDAADYGAPQTRKRMILRAVRDGALPALPEKTAPGDWFAAVEDLIEGATDSVIPPWEIGRIRADIESGRLDPAKPIITMGGSSFGGRANAQNAGGPSPTLKATPNEVPRILMPDGTVKRVTPRMMARLMGLPDSYPVPEHHGLAKTVLGNGIHGAATRALIQPLVDTGPSKAQPSAPEGDFLYHVTLTENVEGVRDRGILMLQPSNWVRDGGERFGRGEIFAFENLEDAVRWAASWDYDIRRDDDRGGQVSIARLRRDPDSEWVADEEGLQDHKMGQSAVKLLGRVPAQDIDAVIPVTNEAIRQLVQGQPLDALFPEARTFDQGALQWQSVGEGLNSDFLAEAEGMIPTDEDMTAPNGLKKNQVGLLHKNRALDEGKVVRVRIDIDFYNRSLRSGIAKFVQTIHDTVNRAGTKVKRGGSAVGARIGYDSSVRLVGEVLFGSEESKATLIHLGASTKTPIAVVEGKITHEHGHGADVIPDDIDDWIPVGYDPKKAPFFYDKRTGQEVLGGTDAVSVGNTVFVREVVSGARLQELIKEGLAEGKPSNYGRRNAETAYADTPRTFNQDTLPNERTLGGVYYSALGLALRGSTQRKMTIKAFRQFLKKRKVKKDEMIWTGLEEYLEIAALRGWLESRPLEEGRSISPEGVSYVVLEETQVDLDAIMEAISLVTIEERVRGEVPSYEDRQMPSTSAGAAERLRAEWVKRMDEGYELTRRLDEDGGASWYAAPDGEDADVILLSLTSEVGPEEALLLTEADARQELRARLTDEAKSQEIVHLEEDLVINLGVSEEQVKELKAYREGGDFIGGVLFGPGGEYGDSLITSGGELHRETMIGWGGTAAPEAVDNLPALQAELDEWVSGVYGGAIDSENAGQGAQVVLGDIDDRRFPDLLGVDARNYIEDFIERWDAAEEREAEAKAKAERIADLVYGPEEDKDDAIRPTAREREPFRGGHMGDDMDDILVHVRWHTRMIVDSKGREQRVLFIDEIQNDWGKAAWRRRRREIDRVASEILGVDDIYDAPAADIYRARQEAKEQVHSDFGYLTPRVTGEMHKLAARVEALKEKVLGEAEAIREMIIQAHQDVIDAHDAKADASGFIDATREEWDAYHLSKAKVVTAPVLLGSDADKAVPPAPQIADRSPEAVMEQFPPDARWGELARPSILAQDRLRNAREELRVAQEAHENIRTHGRLVPDRPFRQEYFKLAMKRMIVEAASKGFDQIAWTSGRMQAERYQDALRSVVDKLEWTMIPSPIAGVGWSTVKIEGSKGGSSQVELEVGPSGIVTAGPQKAVGLPLEDVIPKTIAEQILNTPVDNQLTPDDIVIRRLTPEEYDQREDGALERIHADRREQNIPLDGDVIEVGIERDGQFVTSEVMWGGVPDSEAFGEGEWMPLPAGRLTDAELQLHFWRNAVRRVALREAGGPVDPMAGSSVRARYPIEAEIFARSRDAGGKLEGEEITVGGKGFEDIYDTTLVKVTAEVGGVFDEKVERLAIDELPALTAELNEWLEDQDLEPMSADDALAEHQALPDYDRSVEVEEYLVGFIERWDAAQARQRDKTAGGWVMSIGDEMRESIIENGLPLFQPAGDAEGPRASVTLSDSQILVRLTEASDASSFIHESGHIFLDMMQRMAESPEATDDIKDMWKRAQKFMGHTGGQITGQQHEKFARAFEMYLFEGKAPSIETQGLFLTFSTWMQSIYQTLKQIYRDTPVSATESEEIAYVFDRMIATDQEIAAALAEVESGTIPALAENMTPAQLQAYLAEEESIVANAMSKLLQKVFAQIKKRYGREAEEERRVIRAQVEAELEEDPNRQIEHFLRTGAWPDGEDRGVEHVKMSTKAILEDERYGQAVVDRLGTGRKGLLIQKGVDPEIVAASLQIDSADSLIQMLLSLPPWEAEVEAETSRRLAERHPDLLDEGRMVDEARAEIALSARLQARLERDIERLTNEAEIEKIARRQVVEEGGQEAEQYIRELEEAKGMPRETRNEARDARIAARLARARSEAAKTQRAAQRSASKSVASMKVRLEAIRAEVMERVEAMSFRELTPDQFRARVTREAREVERAIARRDYESALEHKLNQARALEMYRQVRNARAEIEKVREYQKKFDKKATRDRIAQAGPESVEVDRGEGKVTVPGKGIIWERIEAIREKFSFKNISVRERERLLNLAEFQVAMEENHEILILPHRLERRLDEAALINWKDAPLSDLREFRDTLKNLERLAARWNEVRLGRENRSLQDATIEVVNALKKARKPKGFIPIEERERKGTTMSRVHAALYRNESLFEEIDDGPGGGMWSLFMQPFNLAQREADRLMQTIAERLNAALDLIPKADRKRYSKLVWIPEFQQNLTHETLLTVALNWGNLGQRTKLLDGQVKPDGTNWTFDDVTSVLHRELTKADWDFVQGIWDMLQEELWPQIKELHRRVTGLNLEGVEAATVSTPYGEYRGGYYPIVYSIERGTSSQGQKTKELADKALGMRNVMTAYTRHGHDQARQEKVRRPIDLSFRVLTQHLNEVVHDLTHREAVASVHKLMNQKAVREAFGTYLGMPMTNQLKKWLHDIATRGDAAPNGVADGMAKRLRLNGTVVAMGWKFSVMMAQLLGYMDSFHELGLWMGSGIKEFYGPASMNGDRGFVIKNMTNQADWVQSVSPFMAKRATNFDRDIHEISNQTKFTGGWDIEIRRSFFKFIGMMDMAVSYPTWLAAYNQAMSGELENIAKADEQAAIDYADSRVRITQGGAEIKDLAGVQRDSEVMKMFTMFYGYFSVRYARYHKSFHRGGMPGVVAYGILCMLSDSLGELMTGRGPDDEEEDEWKFWVKRGILSLTSPVPFLRDFGPPAILPVLEATIGGEKLPNYGYNPTPALSGVDFLSSTPGKLVKISQRIASGDDLDSSEIQYYLKTAILTIAYSSPFLATTAPGLAQAMNFPARQVWTTVEGFWDWIEGHPDAGAMDVLLRNPKTAE